MELIESARTQLEPLTRAVLDTIEVESQPDAAGFFTAFLSSLALMQEEEDLANAFFVLSSTAFQGFVFSAEQAARVDELLRAAEEIAFALSASGDTPN